MFVRNDQAEKSVDKSRATAGVAFVASGLLVLSVACLPGCNTVEGVGKDVQAAGEGISDAADDD